jgi:drug/metabolite transporter (DMT)-like permease
MVANRPWPRIGPAVGLRLFSMGLFGVFLYNLCFFTGLRTVPAGRGALIVSLQPAVVFLFTALFWRERITSPRLIGLALSLFGAMLVLAQGNPAALFQSGVSTGDLWVLGCVFCWVAYTLIGRGVTARLPAGPATAYSTWFGTALLAIVVAFDPAAAPAWTPSVWLSIAFLGLAGTSLGFLMYVQGLGQVGPSRASIFLNLVPVFGVVFSAVFLGEALGVATLLGGALVILGVRLLNRG